MEEKEKENINFNELWVDKYAPKNIDDLVLDENIKKYFKDMINSRNILNLTFAGPPGIGKSTLCKVICNEINADTLFIPCAVEGNVATAQGKLKEYCNALSFDGRPKVVILDEVDAASATQDSSFQKALRNLIESAQSDTRFLLNCNFIEKVIQPIKSRCPIVNLKFSKKDLLIRLRMILDNEKIKYGKESLKLFVEVAFKLYPDIRRIISLLQGSCTSGELIVNETAISDSEKEALTKELIEKALKSKNLLDVRQFYLLHKDKISDFVIAGSDLFNYCIDNNIVKNCNDVIILSDLLYKLNIVVDKDVGFFAMITFINKIGNYGV